MTDERLADDGRRPWPPVVAWALLIGGYAILWISVTIRAVRAKRLTIDGLTGQIDDGSWTEGTLIGWECVLRHTSTQPMNAVLAVLPVVFILWRVRGWNALRWSALVACTITAVIQALLFITRWADARTTILETREGFVLWVIGPLLIAAAFVVAPPPHRVDPDSGARVFARTSGLRHWATALSVLAVLAFLGSHLLPARNARVSPDDSGWILLALHTRAWIVDGAALFLPASVWFAVRNRDPVWRRIGLVVGAAVLVAQVLGPLFADELRWGVLLIGWYVWWASTLTLLIALAICPTRVADQASAS